MARPFYKSIWEFLKIDFPLTFRNSLLLGIAYCFLIPFIRGISNLDSVHSAEVFGQSLALLGVIIFIPITKNELETGVKEIICTKAWSHTRSIVVRLVCGGFLTAILLFLFGVAMKIHHCRFPFWNEIGVTLLYAMFFGLLGLCFSQLGNTVIAGYFAALGYWSFCQLQMIEEGDWLYLFPVINGEVALERVWLLLGIDIFLCFLFLGLPDRRGRIRFLSKL